MDNAKARIWLGVASGSMQSAGAALKALDTDDKGPDDMAGRLLSLGGNACSALAFGNEKGFNAALRTVADSIYSYLGQQPPDAAAATSDALTPQAARK